MNNKLIKNLLAGVLFAGTAFTGYGQSAVPYVFASAGGSAVATGGARVDFTLGEAIITTAGTNPQLTQGFQQPSTSGTPLGVQLLDFNGVSKKEYNLLSWHTAQEKNNDHFELERSIDGNTFAQIATVYSKAAGGFSAGELAYTYTDRTMTAEVNYYRLKQVDKDGAYTYSAIVRLERNTAGGSLAVVPNPTRDKAVLHVEGTLTRAGIQVADITGRILFSMPVTQAETVIDLGPYANGIYFIRYEDAQRSESVKMVKQ